MKTIVVNVISNIFVPPGIVLFRGSPSVLCYSRGTASGYSLRGHEAHSLQVQFISHTGRGGCAIPAEQPSVVKTEREGRIIDPKSAIDSDRNGLRRLDRGGRVVSSDRSACQLRTRTDRSSQTDRSQANPALTTSHSDHHCFHSARTTPHRARSGRRWRRPPDPGNCCSIPERRIRCTGSKRRLHRFRSGR